MKSLEEFRAEQAAKEEKLSFSAARTSELVQLQRQFGGRRTTGFAVVSESVVVESPDSNGFGRERSVEELAAVVILEFRGEPKDRVWASGKKNKKNNKNKK